MVRWSFAMVICNESICSLSHAQHFDWQVFLSRHKNQMAWSRYCNCYGNLWTEATFCHFWSTSWWWMIIWIQDDSDDGAHHVVAQWPYYFFDSSYSHHRRVIGSDCYLVRSSHLVFVLYIMKNPTFFLTEIFFSSQKNHSIHFVRLSFDYI